MGRLEQIRGAISDLDEEFAKDILSVLLSQSTEGSVYDKSANRQQASVGGASGIKATDSVDFANFAQAISYLKGRFKFKELSRFTTEADLVYVDTGDRKVLLTDRDDPARFAAQNTQSRRPVEDSYSSEDEYFENAFEPSYHRSSKKDAQGTAAAAAAESASAGNNASVEKTYQNSDNNNSANSAPAPEKPQGNSRFSSLEL